MSYNVAYYLCMITQGPEAKLLVNAKLILMSDLATQKAHTNHFCDVFNKKERVTPCTMIS